MAATVRMLPSKPESLADIYRRTIDTAVLAEELGFAHFWVSEAHFAEDAWSPSPLVLLAGIATRTTRIRLGPFVTLVNMQHPLRYAEDAATVDILSNGRLDLGFGAAVIESNAKTFNIDVTGFFARAYEAAEVIQKCFTEEHFSHQGKYFQFPDVRMTTKPVQRPHPPIYWGAMGPQSYIKAAEHNFGLASALGTPVWTTYLDKQRELGRVRPKDFKVISHPFFAHVADSEKTAWDEAEEGMRWMVEYYTRLGMPMPLAPLGEFRKPENAFIHGTPFYVGSPDHVLKMLSAYRDEPVDELAISLGHPGQSFESVKRSMHLFAKEVLPEIKRWGRAGGA